MAHQIIEWAPFRLDPDTTEQRLLAVSDELQRQFLARQEGFVRRELLKKRDGEFVDLIWWSSLRAAEAAVASAANDPVCARYFALMQKTDHTDPGSGISHFLSLKRY